MTMTRTITGTDDPIELSGARPGTDAELLEVLHAFLGLSPDEKLISFSYDVASAQWTFVVG